MDMDLTTRLLSLGVAATIIHVCGCGNSASSRSEITPATTSPPNSKTEPGILDAIVTVTPRCAEELAEYIQEGQTVIISLAKESAGASSRYELEFRESAGIENAIIVPIEGLRLAIHQDDIELVKGTTLDYLPNAGVLKLSNTRSEISLPKEYVAMPARTYSVLPGHIERAKEVDPERAVAELQTTKRQEAFRQLQVLWKLHHPDVGSMAHETVCHVDRYQLPSGQRLTVVFTKLLPSDPGGRTGVIYLINANGLPSPIFQGNNYIEADDRFVDVNGDSFPEIVCSVELAAMSEGNPKRAITEATEVCVIPIASAQVPLLRVLFDNRRFGAEPTWRWRLDSISDGTRVVIIEQRAGNDWTERARYKWSAKKRRFEGPAGSTGDGFIADSGDMDPELYEQFMNRLWTK